MIHDDTYLCTALWIRFLALIYFSFSICRHMYFLKVEEGAGGGERGSNRKLFYP